MQHDPSLRIACQYVARRIADIGPAQIKAMDPETALLVIALKSDAEILVTHVRREIGEPLT